jgi:hypothetical protein
LLRNHLRCGYVVGVGLVPLLGLSLLVFDVVQIYKMGLNPWAALGIHPSSDAVMRALVEAIILALIPPMLIAPWVVRSRGSKRLTRLLRARPNVWTYCYLVLCGFAGYGVIFADGLQVLSGDGLVAGIWQPAYLSVYLLTQRALPSLLLGGAATVISVLGASNRFLGIPGRLSLDEYRSRLELAALPSDYAPVHGREKLNFNSGGMCPLLIGVERTWLEQIREYQASVPGSRAARAYLDERWRVCKELLQTFGVAESAGRQIRFTPGTGRALEIAIRELELAPFVLLSPYEHPTETTVVRESFEFMQMREDLSFFEKHWQEQAEWLAVAVVDVVEKNIERRVVFVVSEVAWSTGLEIPIHDLRKRIEQELRESNVVVDRWPLIII